VQPSENIKSALFMVLSLALFTSGDAIIKFLSDDLPVGQILFVRGIFVCFLFSLVLKYKKQQIIPAAAWNRWNLLRSIFEVAIAGCYLTGLVLLPLATAIILVFCGPIMLTILAATVLNEKVGWRRWCAVITGFIGVILVADLQQASLNSWAALLPLMAAFLTALRDICVRNIPSVLSSTQIAFTTAWMVMLAGLATLPLGWQTLQAEHLAFIGFASLFIMGAYTTYIITTRMGELSFVAPFKYSSIPLAMLIGFLVWGDIPSNSSILGTAVIIASGMVILLRKRQKK